MSALGDNKMFTNQKNILAMRTIKERLVKKIGYIPSDYEIVSMYQSGMLNLTDSEENFIINYIYNTL